MWKKYKKYNVEVNENGEVRNATTKKLRKPTPIHKPNGYLVISIQKDKRSRLLYVHRMVAELFIKNPNNYKCINHIDGDKSNPKASNLEWCTFSENTKKAYNEQNLFKKTPCKICGKEYFNARKQENGDYICYPCKKKEKDLLIFREKEKNKIQKQKDFVEKLKNSYGKPYNYYKKHKNILNDWAKGVKMIEIANKNACTRQNISAIIIKIKEDFNYAHI